MSGSFRDAEDLVLVPGGEFRMGSDDHYAEEAPTHRVRGSLVFTPTPGPVDLRHLSQWWTWMPGASWRYPEGPGSGAGDRADHPVVHVAYEDNAYDQVPTGAGPAPVRVAEACRAER